MAALLFLLNQQNSVINFLRRNISAGYSFPVAAKSATGRRNPCNLKATQHAPGVFFYVAVLAHLYLMVWCFLAFFRLTRHILRIMVVRAGQLSGWPVSFRAGIPTPVRATTHERRNSGGGINRYLKEVAIMATAPVFAHPQFTYLFLALRRADCTARPCPVRVTATSERDARQRLSADFIVCFAGRLPVRNSREVKA
ncbi:host cell division inhibitor Icd-like protein [Atlantibacter subterranea]|uniref:Host cell division inhibitor Icd-like protein n=1 Tax=Atlantibacter subterraneus TaxID=255519 RepID=A0A427UWG5_9ENTR|nr:host cell division inhibitor Icd-like protein [Atlantibacter subterranea]RSB59832.1 host cell division inhibitor Icd-like protein [Atlantibacter subterranea]RSE03807.1 host cell division inhibitor Icd-like protein [Atlantibacter subterranea]RSE24805.1 host cell division inhibitor Icd-like protein [Atlantibacter subterranea]